MEWNCAETHTHQKGNTIKHKLLLLLLLLTDVPFLKLLYWKGLHVFLYVFRQRK